MAALNFVDLAAAVSPDAPCGADLEDDPDFMNVVARLEVALPTSFFRRDDEGRQIPFDRASLDFPSAFADLGKLLAQTRDLRLFVLTAKFALLNRDIGSFASSLNLIADNLGEHWDEFHPRPQGSDLIMREVALQTLDDNATVVLPLQHAPLFTSRRVGPLAFRSQLVASGETRLVEGEQHPDTSTIQAALNEADIAELTTAFETARTIGEALARISAVWADKSGASLSFPRLSALTGQILGFLDTAVARRVPGHAVQAVPAETGDGPTPSMAVAAAGACTSIIQVKDALSTCLDYFRRTEPSSPAVLLIGQAQHLIGKSLIEVIQIMFPEHVDKAMIAVGQDFRFQLPLERLASFEPEVSDDDTDSGDDGDDASADDETPAQVSVFATPVASRGEAVSRMAAVARFYRQAEPSHPTPLLMDKACALAQHDFMSLLGDILPGVAMAPDDGS
jgi:type VI secretion system protein ImpA